jgi:hypothetical protein
MYQIKYNPDKYVKRWVGYFDLLGTKELIQTGTHLTVFSIYTRSMEEVKKRKATLECIRHAWFSDTFLLFTDDESISSFGELDHIARWFLYFLIEGHIPVRGAISYGEFYADEKNNLFFGKSLIEAYEYAEAQDWIGFVLCPTTESKLNSIDLFTDKRLNYAYADIPYNKRGNKLAGRLPACILGNWVEINNQNPSLKRLYQMRSEINDERIVAKYDNAIEFITRNKRTAIS